MDRVLRRWLRVVHALMVVGGACLPLAAGCSGGNAGGTDRSASSPGGTPAGASQAPAAETALARRDSLARLARLAVQESVRVAQGSAGAGSTGGASVATATGHASGKAKPADLGARVFAKHCARCHGPTGHGDGKELLVPDHPARNFHDVAYMSTRTDEELLISIRHGREQGAMPRWDSILSEEEIQAVLRHVRSFAKTP